ncbi:hypothetical protein GOP47_0001412, partial [Adiantum capillus-veneris]
MEDIFKGTKQFKVAVFQKVQLDLSELDLVIYNANVKQLVNVPGHEYLSFLGQMTWPLAPRSPSLTPSIRAMSTPRGGRVSRNVNSAESK